MSLTVRDARPTVAALTEALPELYSTEDTPEVDKVAPVKLFTPWSGWTWYLTEFSAVAPDGCTNLAFGYTVGHESEWGYVSIDELLAIRGPGGLRIERDIYWDEATPVWQILTGQTR